MEQKIIRVYLAHPYSGLEGNKLEIERYMETFNNSPNADKYEIVSPVHIFEKEYTDLPYLEGIELCFALLDTCDVVLFPEDIFMNSKGCCMEYGYAIAQEKTIYFYNKNGEVL